jgi:hypothetical protein
LKSDRHAVAVVGPSCKGAPGRAEHRTNELNQHSDHVWRARGHKRDCAERGDSRDSGHHIPRITIPSSYRARVARISRLEGGLEGPRTLAIPALAAFVTFEHRCHLQGLWQRLCQIYFPLCTRVSDKPSVRDWNALFVQTRATVQREQVRLPTRTIVPVCSVLWLPTRTIVPVCSVLARASRRLGSACRCRCPCARAG